MWRHENQTATVETTGLRNVHTCHVHSQSPFGVYFSSFIPSGNSPNFFVDKRTKAFGSSAPAMAQNSAFLGQISSLMCDAACTQPRGPVYLQDRSLPCTPNNDGPMTSRAHTSHSPRVLTPRPSNGGLLLLGLAEQGFFGPCQIILRNVLKRAQIRWVRRERVLRVELVSVLIKQMI